MYPLFESLCIQNGKILNSKWHEKRFRKAYLKYFGKPAYFNLLDEVNIPKEFKKGNVKLRVLYGETGREIQFEIYKLRKINTIKLVHVSSLKYPLKFIEREKLNSLFEQRGACDDVIIVRDGQITDSSYANLIFFDGREWITPKYPLLKGTCRARLLANGKIKMATLGIQELKAFKGLKLINAMRDIDQELIPMDRILH